MGISVRQLEQIQRRLDVKGPKPEQAVSMSEREVPDGEVILGIDPSLRGTGYGIIRVEKQKAVALGHGTVRCRGEWPHSACLVAIAAALRGLMAEHQPDACVMESLFYAQNLQTAIVMGEARGAAMVAVAEAGVKIYEIAPRKVKQAIVGYGGAQKTAVAKMVQHLLELPAVPEADAADALALALTFAREQSRFAFRAPKSL